MKQVLIVDHQDSFVWNLVQIVRETEGCSFTLIDGRAESKVERLLLTHPYVLLSPGPGHPTEHVGLLPLIQRCSPTHSILGVCLGMQAIALAYGGQLRQLSTPKHGHRSLLKVMHPNTLLLQGLPQQADKIAVGRYHSWAVTEPLPQGLRVDAYDDDNNVAMLSHVEHRVYGVQFHPESIISSHGVAMVRNWLSI